MASIVVRRWHAMIHCGQCVRRGTVCPQGRQRIRPPLGFDGFPFPVISRGVRFVFRGHRCGRWWRHGCQWLAVPRHGLPDEGALGCSGAVPGDEEGVQRGGRRRTWRRTWRRAWWLVHRFLEMRGRQCGLFCMPQRQDRNQRRIGWCGHLFFHGDTFKSESELMLAVPGAFTETTTPCPQGLCCRVSFEIVSFETVSIPTVFIKVVPSR